ncbi:type IV toxin-antitoxin system AbiEi family antitoxin [Cellulomonas sp. 179-A 9B4 NHS]|uniref:type IV toxin-antitoxin system AbiEi family antitoxin n=1 Tax=Cellulomonas sp. 179-A 9B4 NHS TaxID=3142379 RepID=UPI0039A000A6
MATSLPDGEREDVDERVSAIREALRARGIGLTLSGDTAVLDIDGMRVERPWQLTEAREPRGDLLQGGWLLLADRMPPARAEAARARGDWYADRSGRAYVRAPGVLVDIGDQDARRPRRSNRSAASGHHVVQNPMSPSRAQVVCLLLDDPRLASASLRTLAERSGVSVGIAQQVMSDLEARRFLRHGREGLNRVDELLDQWAGVFGNGLGPKLELGRFSGDPRLDAWLSRGQSVYRSGEAASPELHGADVTIYVERLDLQAVMASRWNPSGDRLNIVVRRKFWGGSAPVPDLYDALLPLRLADLLITDDPRHRLAARPLREELLRRHAR